MTQNNIRASLLVLVDHWFQVLQQLLPPEFPFQSKYKHVEVGPVLADLSVWETKFLSQFGPSRTIYTRSLVGSERIPVHYILHPLDVFISSSSCAVDTDSVPCALRDNQRINKQTNNDRLVPSLFSF